MKTINADNNNRFQVDSDRVYWHWGSVESLSMGTKSFPLAGGWFTATDEYEAAELAELLQTEANEALVRLPN